MAKLTKDGFSAFSAVALKKPNDDLGELAYIAKGLSRRQLKKILLSRKLPVPEIDRLLKALGYQSETIRKGA